MEIRPVDRDELLGFLRIVPAFAGTPTWEPEPAAWHAGPGMVPPFGAALPEERLTEMAAVWPDLDRTRGAFDGGRIVGTAQLFSLEVTVPGTGPVPLGAVSIVGVLPTHRRRGLMTGMMRQLVDDCWARGEALAGLSASDGALYGRYGFGPATFHTRWELDIARVQQRAPRDWRGRIELVDAETAAKVWPGLHDGVRATRVGEVSAHHLAWPGRAAGPGVFALRYDEDGTADGAAVYRTPWAPDRESAGTVEVGWLEAASDAAYADLWTYLTGLDHTRRVVAARRPVDEPFRWRLADPRALRVTRQSDNLWLRLVDVAGALAGRTYAVEGSLVIDVADAFCAWNAGRWALEGGPQGARCERAPSGAAADLALDAATLASLFLGGTAPGALAAAGLVREDTAGALGRLTAMLTAPRAPHNAIGF